MTYQFPQSNKVLSSVTGNTTVTVPAGNYIVAVLYQNETGNAVTGGIKVGTTAGGTDVVIALAVGANAIGSIPDASLLKRYFSASVDTTLYIQTVTLWNSASVNLTFVLAKIA